MEKLSRVHQIHLAAIKLIMVHKIAIIGGAGSVGSTVAYSLILRKIATEIILVDIDEKRCEGCALNQPNFTDFVA